MRGNHGVRLGAMVCLSAILVSPGQAAMSGRWPIAIHYDNRNHDLISYYAMPGQRRIRAEFQSNANLFVPTASYRYDRAFMDAIIAMAMAARGQGGEVFAVTRMACGRVGTIYWTTSTGRTMWGAWLKPNERIVPGSKDDMPAYFSVAAALAGAVRPDWPHYFPAKGDPSKFNIVMATDGKPDVRIVGVDAVPAPRAAPASPPVSGPTPAP